ncbi:MAG TPA: CoA-binding protein [Planctomycetaceae bacterium]|nr:CoA-binding protein [Planctomycetaceae bacterium]
MGASADRAKFGNKSVRAHLKAGYEVYPVNPSGGRIEGLPVYRSLAEVPAERLDRISVYLRPDIGLTVLDDLTTKAQSAEIWFNPGSASPALLARARKLGLNVVAGCSIVDLGLSPSQFPGS